MLDMIQCDNAKEPSKPSREDHSHQARVSRAVGVAHLVVVLHDCLLASTCINPCHKVLHMSCDKHSRIGDRRWADTDMPLLDSPDGLQSQPDHTSPPTSDTLSAILSLVATTANRRRAIEDTVTLFSMSDGFAPTSRMPMSYSLFNISASFC